MIKRIELHNWKSFKNSILYIDQMTFVIGANASGKSNALDALDFLREKTNTISDFKVGLKVPGKLKPVNIAGGVLLMETTYTMRESFI